MKNAFSAALPVAVAAAIAAISTGAEASRIVNQKIVENDLPYNGFIVRYKDGTTARTDMTAARSAVMRSATRLATSRSIDTSFKANANGPFAFELIRKLSNEAHLIKSSRKLTRSEALATLNELAANPDVDYVEPNGIYRHQLVPNDPMYSQQWGYGQSGIRAETAWELATGAGVTVAVLDTGMAAHPDTDANVVAGYDFVTMLTRSNDGDGRDGNASDPGDPCPEYGEPNSSWHGTHVAGTIAARTNNGVGVAGVAFNAKIMPVRVLGKCGGESADIADAITWSSGGTVGGMTLPANQVAKVINMSLGGGGDCPQVYLDAISGASSRGTTVVAAAGNSNADASGFAPASCPGVIAVAAVDVNNNKAWFSNFGPRVDVAAPGVNILSTLNTGLTAPVAPDYRAYNGTSMAAPHVAGVVALVQSRRLALGLPLFTPEQMRSLIKVATRPLTGACPEGCGTGMVDASAAVAFASVSSAPVNYQSDASGKLRVVLFERKAPAAASQFSNFSVDVPEDYVVIGGGVRGAAAPKAHLLTASYPNTARSAWLVSTRDVQQSNPTAITGWALALKVEGMSRAQLLANMAYRVTTGATSANPTASSALPSGYVQLGGGFQLTSTTASNVAWSSFPSSVSGWTVAAKEHGVSSVSGIRSHVIGLRTNLPVGLVTVSSASAVSAAAQAQPTASVGLAAGHVLTGCGARVNWEGGAGNLLWQIEPKVAPNAASCEARGTEHLYSSPATIGVHSLGIRLN